jgi:hypothetical protein
VKPGFLVLLPSKSHILYVQYCRSIHSKTLAPKFDLIDFNKKVVGKIVQMNRGAGFTLVKGIISHLDWSLDRGVAFTDNATNLKYPGKSILFLSFMSTRVRMFKSNSKFQSFSLPVSGCRFINIFFLAIL